MKRLLLNGLKPVINPVTSNTLKNYYQANLQAQQTTEKRVLLLAPHVDDETIGAGATLRKYAEQGGHVTVAYLTDGAGSVSELKKDELVRRRKDEANEIKDILKISEMVFFDEPDGELTSHDRIQEKVKKLILDKRPEVIYCPVYVDCHSDHIATGRILKDVLPTLEQDYLDKVRIRLYEINTALPVSEINFIVDVSDTYHAKEKGVKVFSSQAIDFDGFLKLAHIKANLLKAKPKAAEVFLDLSPASFQKRFTAIDEKYTYSDYFKQVNKTATLLLAIFKNITEKTRFYEESKKGGAH